MKWPREQRRYQAITRLQTTQAFLPLSKCQLPWRASFFSKGFYIGAQIDMCINAVGYGLITIPAYCMSQGMTAT